MNGIPALSSTCEKINKLEKIHFRLRSIMNGNLVLYKIFPVNQKIKQTYQLAQC